MIGFLALLFGFNKKRAIRYITLVKYGDSGEQKELIELLFLEGFTQNEVAALKGMPLGTVKTKSRMALTKLKEFV